MGNLSQTLYKKLSRTLLIVIAAVSALAFVLIVVFSARYIMDCVTAENSIHFAERNAVSYVLHTEEGNDFYPAELTNRYSYYRRQYTDHIQVKAGYTANVDKATPMTYTASYTAALLVRNANNGNNGLIWDEKTDLGGASGDCNFVNGQFTLQKSFDLYLETYEERLQAYLDDAKANGVTLSVVGEVVFTAEYQLTGKEDKTVKTDPIARSVTIQLQKELYTVAYSGKDNAEAFIPERAVRLPALWASILIVLGVAVSLTALIVALKAAFQDPDEFRAAYKRIMRKYYNEVALVASAETPIFKRAVAVESFDELLKFSLNLAKPITCYKTEDFALFAIACDNIYYQYTLARGKAQ